LQFVELAERVDLVRWHFLRSCQLLELIRNLLPWLRLMRHRLTCINELGLLLDNLVLGSWVVWMLLVEVLLVNPIYKLALIAYFLPLFFLVLLNDRFFGVDLHLADEDTLLIFHKVSLSLNHLYFFDHAAELVAYDAVDLVSILLIEVQSVGDQLALQSHLYTVFFNNIARFLMPRHVVGASGI